MLMSSESMRPVISTAATWSIHRPHPQAVSLMWLAFCYADDAVLGHGSRIIVAGVGMTLFFDRYSRRTGLGSEGS